MYWCGGSPPHPIACRCSGVGLLHFDHNIQGLCSQTRSNSLHRQTVEDDKIGQIALEHWLVAFSGVPAAKVHMCWRGLCPCNRATPSKYGSSGVLLL